MNDRQFRTSSATLRAVAALTASAVVFALFTAVVAIGAPDRAVLAAAAAAQAQQRVATPPSTFGIVASLSAAR